MTEDAFEILESGPIYAFRDWPNLAVPRVAAGVYTVWEATWFLYVGMAGEKLTADKINRLRATNEKKGLFLRLDDHASGKRSGDKFCIYICDRFVLKTLTQEDIIKITAGKLSLDNMIGEFIRRHLSYRFAVTNDGRSVRDIEKAVKQGRFRVGKPYLNPW